MASFSDSMAWHEASNTTGMDGHDLGCALPSPSPPSSLQADWNPRTDKIFRFQVTETRAVATGETSFRLRTDSSRDVWLSDFVVHQLWGTAKQTTHNTKYNAKVAKSHQKHEKNVVSGKNSRVTARVFLFFPGVAARFLHGGHPYFAAQHRESVRQIEVDLPTHADEKPLPQPNS